MLDYELEVAAVIGADGQIGGFAVMNDWSARDIQRQEMRVGLVPAKAKGSWADILDQAAANTALRPGDVIGSGTVGTGCILEHDDGRWLVPGDTVELEVAGLGVLRNRIGPPSGQSPADRRAPGRIPGRQPGRAPAGGA